MEDFGGQNHVVGILVEELTTARILPLELLQLFLSLGHDEQTMQARRYGDDPGTIHKASGKDTKHVFQT